MSMLKKNSEEGTNMQKARKRWVQAVFDKIILQVLITDSGIFRFYKKKISLLI